MVAVPCHVLQAHSGFQGQPGASSRAATSRAHTARLLLVARAQLPGRALFFLHCVGCVQERRHAHVHLVPPAPHTSSNRSRQVHGTHLHHALVLLVNRLGHQLLRRASQVTRQQDGTCMCVGRVCGDGRLHAYLLVVERKRCCMSFACGCGCGAQRQPHCAARQMRIMLDPGQCASCHRQPLGHASCCCMRHAAGAFHVPGTRNVHHDDTSRWRKLTLLPLGAAVMSHRQICASSEPLSRWPVL